MAFRQVNKIISKETPQQQYRNNKNNKTINKQQTKERRH